MASMDDLIATMSSGLQAGQHGRDLQDLHVCPILYAVISLIAIHPRFPRSVLLTSSSVGIRRIWLFLLWHKGVLADDNRPN